MKTNFTVIKFSLFLLSFSMVFTSCDNDDPIEIIEGTKGPYANGLFITNEGGFGNSNGSISFYNYEEDTAYNMEANTVYNNVFQNVNSRVLGDVIQSMNVKHDSLGFILVNNSNKIEVVDHNTLQEVYTIEEVAGPRYMEIGEEKGYVSCWGDNTVKVIDLETYSVSKSIAVGAGPEKMAIANNKLFVANAGGWGTDSVISVIDLETEEVISSIEVKYSPRDIEVDKDGNLWVLCFGKVVYDPVTYALVEETASMVYKINPNSNSVVAEIELFGDQHPTTLEIDNDGSTLYFGGGFGFGGIYSLVIEGSSATTTKIIEDYAYGFAYDLNSEKLFVTVAPDFTGAGELYRYSVDGTKVGTYSVGIGPNGASFKNASF